MNQLCIVFCGLLIILLSLSGNDARTSDILKVKLPYGGALVGRYLNSVSGRGIRAFLGIPYAEPPVGVLRFKPPVPITTWQGEKQVVNDIPICIQRDPFRRDYEIEGSEDCLYLNVYAPVSPKTVGPLPVMIFFHGGGWQCGSGSQAFYGPDFILDHDVIYIGANFRLGPLGFLSTEQEDCPGNNGLKDQVMVLKWIKENVASFGGNPDQVTVFGESAGGASGTYHMMSPLSKGLFHKVISQSGTNLDAWSQPAHKGVAQKRAIELGAMLNCPIADGNFKVMLDCLRNVSASDVTKSFYDFFKWDTDPMIPFPPVVEPDLPGAFITKHPRDEYEPHGLELPWITGITTDEGAMKSAALINEQELTNDLTENWEKALTVSLYYDHHDENIQQHMTEKINKYYFNNQKLVPETRQNLTNLYTDGWFLAGMDEYLRIRLLGKKNQNVGPTYVYLFAQKAAASFTEIFKGGSERYYGVCHAEELQYLFPIAKDLFVKAVPTKADLEVRRTITEMWVNFAYTSNPTPENSGLVSWQMTDNFPLNYLRIGSKEDNEKHLIAMESGLLEERAEFWRNLGAHLSTQHLLRDEL